MSATNAFETSILELIFKNTNNANIGDATGLRGSTTAGVFNISLHIADPGEAGTQSTSEATYGGYARFSVARSGVGFTVTGDALSNAAAIAFATCTSGTNTITHFGIGTDASGAGNLLFKGALTNSVAVSVGNPIPTFAIGALTTTAA